MANITTDEVARIAHLARIALSAAETKQMTDELSAILGYVEKLNTVNTANTVPTSQVTGLKSVWRKDEVKPSLATDQALANTPKTQDGYIKVPKVL